MAKSTTPSSGEPGDRPFNPANKPFSIHAASVVADVTNQLQRFETHVQARARARKANDQLVFERTVEALVCDVIVRYLQSPSAWISVPLSKRNYIGRQEDRPTALNKQLPQIVERLARPELEFIELRKGTYGHFGGRQSTVRAGKRLIDRIRDLRLTAADFGHHPRDLGDPLVLRPAKIKGRRGRPLPIPDNSHVRRLRQEMRQINAALEAADVVVTGSIESGVQIDESKRFLRRIFSNGSLEHGGRLYGGFWQDMSKIDRSELIAFGVGDGEYEAAAEVDFGQVGLRIAYSLANIPAPGGDLYCIAGLEGSREGVKRVLNAILAHSRELKRYPAGTKKYFPTKSFDQVADAIYKAHRPVAHLFGQATVHKIQFVESEVMVRALLELGALGIAALPIHDCVLIAERHTDPAKAVLLKAFRDVTGTDGVVG